MKNKKAKDIKKGNTIYCGPKNKNLGKVTAVSEPYAGGKRIEFKFLDGKKKGKTDHIVLDDTVEVNVKTEWKEKKYSGQYFWLGYMLGMLTWALLTYGEQYFPNGILH